MGTINAEWHKINRMPKNATHEERVRWHSEHAKHCMCRMPPPNLQKEIEESRRRQG